MGNLEAQSDSLYTIGDNRSREQRLKDGISVLESKVEIEFVHGRLTQEEYLARMRFLDPQFDTSMFEAQEVYTPQSTTALEVAGQALMGIKEFVTQTALSAVQKTLESTRKIQQIAERIPTSGFNI